MIHGGAADVTVAEEEEEQYQQQHDKGQDDEEYDEEYEEELYKSNINNRMKKSKMTKNMINYKMKNMMKNITKKRKKIKNAAIIFKEYYVYDEGIHYEGYYDEYYDDYWDLVLRFVCEDDPRLRPIKSLVALSPHSIKVRDMDGALPLHIACQTEGTSLDAIRFLVDRWPESVQERVAIGGYLPLHLACRAHANGSFHPRRGGQLEIVRYLVEKWPRSVREKTPDGMLPLWEACRSGNTREVIEYLMIEQSKAGSHWACTISSAPMIALKHLQRTCPEWVKQKTVHGKFPLHLAVEAGEPLWVIRWLLWLWPEAIRRKDIFGNTVLHLACFYNAPLDVVYFLAREWPEPLQNLRTR